MKAAIVLVACLVAVAYGQTCKDKLSPYSCNLNKSRGYCTVERYRFNYCAKTCGGCVRSTTCWDKSTSCKYFKNRCSSSFAKTNCKYTCGIKDACANGGSVTRPTPGPTTPRVTTPSTPKYTGPTTTEKPIVRQGTCGVSKLGHDKMENVFTPYIVGGREAAVGRWPWMADLYNGGRHSCGGVVINSKYILTAAHCVARSSARSLKIRVGWHDQKKAEPKGVEHAVAEIIGHKGYGSIASRGILNDNDIALLRLTKEIDFSNEHVNVVCLPSPGEKFSGECTATGWGMTMGTGDMTKLREVTVPVYTTQECLRQWPGKVSDRQICMGTTVRSGSGRKTACRGDSGGPLVCNKQGRWILSGVTSWGTRDCVGRPAVYTRVSAYIDWINANMKM